jgi:hypothetical protein
MEIAEKKFLKMTVPLSLILFFASVVIFQFWLEPQSDFPHTDEYQSLLSALGFPTYTPNLHVQMLTFFTNFFPDFRSLVEFNFISSHIVLALSFFLYHWKKGLNYGTLFVITSILTLSTINIALTRKMHFWAAAFFFVILFTAEFFQEDKEKERKIFLFCSFLILGFFRVEFLFSAAVALAMLIRYFSHKKKIFSMIVAGGSLLAVFGILKFGYGMIDLLIESFRISGQTPGPLKLFFSWIKIFSNNLGLHLYYTIISFFTTLRIFFPTLAIAFAVLIYLIKKPVEGMQRAKKVVFNTYLPFYFPAMIALFSVRFMDFYIIMTFVFFLSILAFAIDTKLTSLKSILILVLVLPAFFLARPELKGSAYINFPTFKRGERIHRQMFDIIATLEVKKNDAPYKIFFNQYVAGVLPYEGREYFMNSDLKNICKKGPVVFDIALLTGKWFSDPDQKLIDSCVRPGLLKARLLKLAPGYDLYLSERISINSLSRISSFK